MKYILAIYFFILAFVFAQSAQNKLKCDISSSDPSQPKEEWVNMTEGCISKMRSQVKEELQAALTYMSMGAHFSQDTVNRPGFAKFFFESASEEREHAIKIIKYLLMRGELTNNIGSIIQDIKPHPVNLNTGLDALKEALKLEIHVTKKIREIIKICEHDHEQKQDDENNEKETNDYHLVDYLTGEFLEEQLNGQRDLAGKKSTLERMMHTHKEIGEFLFDKNLL